MAWAEAEDEYRQVISAYTAAMGAEPLDRAALAIIAKARSKAERCLDAYARRCLGT